MTKYAHTAVFADVFRNPMAESKLFFVDFVGKSELLFEFRGGFGNLFENSVRVGVYYLVHARTRSEIYYMKITHSAVMHFLARVNLEISGDFIHRFRHFRRTRILVVVGYSHIIETLFIVCRNGFGGREKPVGFGGMQMRVALERLKFVKIFFK